MSSERRPADEVEREIIRGVRDETLFVAAGAGSGKTRELVARIVGLVAGGADLRQMAAITFTNAAAAELRDRVRFELGRAGSGKAYDHFTAEQRTNCREALDVIDAAAIQTLHSFAQGVLALYPIQAGLPPEVTVRDEVGASIAFQEHWDRFLEDLLKDGCGDPALERPLIYGLGLGLTTAHLRRIAWQFHHDWDRVIPATFEHPTMPRISAAEVIPLLEEAVALKRENTNDSDKAYRFLTDEVQLDRLVTDLKDAQQALDATKTEDERLAAEERVAGLLAGQKLGVGPRTGNKGNWRGGALASLREVTVAAEGLRLAMLSELRRACLGPVLTAIQRFVREYRDERVRQGTLEFHDMLYLARDLLRRETSVRLAVGRRFRTLLIDEFQDTDPIQIEIAVLVASSDPEAGDKHWSEVEVEPGRLFFVGDPKQSIYRFRRADIDLYQEAASRFGSEGRGRDVHLVQNFRSVPSVIAWSNHVFDRLFDLERKGGAAGQVEFEELQPYREGDGRPEPAVRVFGGPIEGENIHYVRQVEAAAIAGVISEVRDEGADGAWLVGEGDGWRAPRFGDIAILLPTRTALPAIESALNEAGIPCRIESRSLLFETQEVRDLLSILNAIDDPTDQVAVVAALRSPGFGCSDADLWQWAQAGGRWNPRSTRPEGYPPDGAVARAMQTLREWNDQRWWMEPAELIDLVLRERRLFQVAFAAKRPRDSWHRLRFVHEQARAFQLAGGRGLRQFVQYMERRADEQARLTETAIAEHDDDAVRIMTVHASKGLEFPIVILAGLARGENTQGPVMLWSAEGGPEVRVGKQEEYFETPGYEAQKASEDAMERLEDDRLLYVAATRARDHLVVSTFYKLDGRDKRDHSFRHADNKCSAAECLYAICGQAPEGLLTVIEPGQTRPAARDGRPDGNGRRDSAADREAWSAGREALISATAKRPALAATSVARFLPRGEEEVDAKEEQLEEEAPWKKGRAGTSVGRAVHAVLQTIDLETGEGIEAAARAQSIAEGVEDRFDDILAYASAALRSRAVNEAIASGRYWREVYVSAQVEGTALEGFVDLLYETPEGLVVVDYKTDAVRNEAAIEERMGHYRLQGAAYALALAEALGRPVDRCVFVFAQAGREREIVDLASAIEEVRGLIPAAMAAAGV